MNIKEEIIVKDEPLELDNNHDETNYEIEKIEETINVQHILQLSEPKPYHCSQCGNNFKQNVDLKNHLIGHPREKTFQCKLYLMKHSGKSPYQCSHCDNVFMIKDQLNIHMRIHTELKPYQCSQCDASFSIGGSLKKHIKNMHTYVKLFQCQECSKYFSCKSKMMDHLITHSVEKPKLSANVRNLSFRKIVSK